MNKLMEIFLGSLPLLLALCFLYGSVLDTFQRSQILPAGGKVSGDRLYILSQEGVRLLTNFHNFVKGRVEWSRQDLVAIWDYMGSIGKPCENSLACLSEPLGSTWRSSEVQQRIRAPKISTGG